MDNRYRTGEPAIETGIYGPLNHPHMSALVVKQGDYFPPCSVCQCPLEFRLERTAPYLLQDEDFE